VSDLDDAARHFERRLDERELRLALAAWERATAQNPGDAVAWGHLARARFFLADAFLTPRLVRGERGAERELIAAHEAGAEAAARGLDARSPELAKDRRRGVAMHKLVTRLGAGDMELAFWWAQNVALAAKTKGKMAIVKTHEAVFRTMERVHALAPDTFYGGPDRYFGVVYCAAPLVIGGSLSKGRDFFEASLARAPTFLSTYYLYLKLWAEPAGDRRAEAGLRARALAIVVDALPEITPEQTTARRLITGEVPSASIG
jgi:hypothetical protein